MSERAPGRRARAARGAATRARILDAVVASLDEVGFARTTSHRIAECAGVSVGAVQHHFPAKADILSAVLERSFENLSAQFEGVSLAGASLPERVNVFVERAWQHYGSAAFRSTLEILSNAPDLARHGSGDREPAPIVASARSATRLWSFLFADTGLPPARQREIRNFAFASLSGLAMTQRLRTGTQGARSQVAMLETSLLALFEQALADHGATQRARAART